MAVKRNGKATTNNRTTTRRRQPLTVARPLALNRVNFQQWIAMDGQPEIAQGNTIYNFGRGITPFRFPELQDYMTRYQTVTLHSLGARFRSGMENVTGNVGIYVLTDRQEIAYTIPTAPNHAWLKRNGCVVSPCRAIAHSPPASDTVKSVVACVPSTGNNNQGTRLGYVFWVFEGPQSAAARSHLGEVEVYVNATFDGLG